MKIFLDIETIPCQIESVKSAIAADVKPPATYKKAESIAEWERDKKPLAVEEELKKTSFDGAFGQVCCVSMAIDDDEPVTFYEQDWLNSEKKILTDFFALINGSYNRSRDIPPMFIGHNIVNFDLRFLFHRAVILGIRFPAYLPINGKAWDRDIFDTMTYWAGHNGRVSLDKLCKVLNLPQKGSEIGEEIDGSMVWGFVRDGKIDLVAKYCAADVERVREIYKRLNFEGI